MNIVFSPKFTPFLAEGFSLLAEFFIQILCRIQQKFFLSVLAEVFFLQILRHIQQKIFLFSRSFFPKFYAVLSRFFPSVLAEVFSPKFTSIFSRRFFLFQQKFFLQILNHIQQVIFLQFQQKFVLQISCRRILCFLKFSRIFFEKAHSQTKRIHFLKKKIC